MVAVSAPGKLILMGEHGAVYGVPALVATVDLRATAELSPGTGKGVDMELPDLGITARAGWGEIVEHAARARRRWQAYQQGGAFERDDHPAALVRVALGETAQAVGAETLPPLRLRLRSQLPVGSGFGSSAAVAVSVIAGLLAWLGLEPQPEEVDRLALEVERRQHGRPSGIDHGTVLRGGMQWAERDPEGALRLHPVRARPAVVGEFQVLDSGPPAEDTGTVVAAVARRRRDEAGFEQVLAGMGKAVRAFRAALESGEREILATAMGDFQRCLEQIGVVPEPVRQAIRELERLGIAAKISGAGALSGTGAGCLVAFPRPSSSVPLAAGWRRVDCALGAPGMRVEAG